MIADALFAVVAAMVGIATALFFYGAGLMSGFENGRRHERKVLGNFHRRAINARTGIN
jgi:hypothetical protein